MSKVLFVIDPVVPISEYNSTGSTNTACKVCKGLAEKGLDIVLAGNWDTEDVDIREYVTPLNIYDPSTRLHMKKAFQMLNEHLETNEYMSISVHISTPSVAKYLNTINSGSTPVYFTLHSWSGTSAVSYYHKEDYVKLIEDKKVKMIFLCESQMRQMFDQFGLTPSHYIIEPNAIPDDLIESIDEEESFRYVSDLLPKHFIEDGYVLTVSRFVKSKHPDAVVDAAVIGGHNLVIIGDNWINDQEYADEVRTKISNNPDKVFWIPRLSHRDVLQVMKNASSLVLFTDMECCNLTVLESCLMGTPIVVGPRGTGIADSIDNLKTSDVGVSEIVFPYRSPWWKKLKTLSDLIGKSMTSGRYDVSKFPDCYKWSTHIDNCYKIVTNQMQFVEGE